MNNRISGAIDLYHRTTHDMVLRFPGPLSSGVVDPGLLLNAGKMRNRGVELSLNTRNIVGDFSWSTDLTFAYNRNKILDLAGLSPELVTAHPNIINLAGKPTGMYYLAEYAGIDKATGQELIYDQNRNIVPATSAAQIDAARSAVEQNRRAEILWRHQQYCLPAKILISPPFALFLMATMCSMKASAA